MTPGLQEVDEIVTGVIRQPTGARDSLAPLVLCWIETDVLILVGTVCVGARAKERKCESKAESRGAHVIPHVVF